MRPLTMNRINVTIIGLVFLLAGCAGAPVKTYSPQPQVVNIPELNTEADAEIGQTIVSKAFRRVYPAISLPNEVIEGRFGTLGKIRIHAGILYLYSEDENGKYYRDPRAEWGGFDVWNPAVGGIFVPRDSAKPPVNFHLNPVTGFDLGKMPSEGITHTTYEASGRDAFKRELVYAGVSQNTISILYREFQNDFARPAFSQELKYDLAQGNEIGFRGARFQVLKATNTSIRYKVLRAMD